MVKKGRSQLNPGRALLRQTAIKYTGHRPGIALMWGLILSLEKMSLSATST